MKKEMLALAMATAVMGSVKAQDIKLPQVDMKAVSKSMMETLATRHSVREYSNEELSLQAISNLCWAACGVSRDAEHRTSPTAMNRKEIRLFAFTAKGAYEYDAAKNVLRLVAKGDNRKLVAGFQDFAATAPLSLVMVIDFDLFGNNDENAMRMCCVDAGNVSENINLYCQSVGLATVPRASMDGKGISKLLKLGDKQMPILNNPVGYPKK